MPSYQNPHQDTPPQGPNGPSGPSTPSGDPTNGLPIWTHMEIDPAFTALATLQAARLGTWEDLPQATRARYLRAFVVMSLQAATLRSDLRVLGTYKAADYADDEHNAAAAAVARTLLLLAPRKPVLISQSMFTNGGEPAILSQDPGTGLGWMAIVAIGAACAAAGAALGWWGAGSVEKNDSADFRDHKTKQLTAAQAAAIEVLTKHAEREKLAGKPLPFTEEEKRLLTTLEDTQKAIVAERRQPLPAPYDGAKSFSDVLSSATGTLSALLPLVLAGGALYLLSRYGGELLPAHSREGPTSAPDQRHLNNTITLTRNKEGVYEYDERHGQG